jgi:ribosomal protein S18 acetylase RimI-like enzyme
MKVFFMEEFNITNSDSSDIDAIFNLYDTAVAFQKEKFDKHWEPFSRDMVEKEIEQKRQWKIMSGDAIACIFVAAESDSLIWEKKDNDPSIYIHRIVTNPAFRGNNFVSKIVEWTKGYARSKDKKFIRLDTWGDNQKLIDYYINCGFSCLGITTPTGLNKLPLHYEGITLSLFQMPV